MKKFITILLCAAMLLPFSAASAAAFSDTENLSGEYQDAIQLTNVCKIFGGDENGNFNPENYISRAETAKIACALSGCSVTLDGGGLFSDLPQNYWANGYINTAAKNKILLGYPNGCFAPENSVTYAEEITVLLRVLGYTNADIGNDYPYSQLEKAKDLGLTDGISFNFGDAALRKDVALISARALLCETNSTSSRKSKLIESLKYTVSDECIFIASQKQDASLMQDEIYTSLGEYKYKNLSVESFAGKTVKLVFNSDNEVVYIIDCGKNVETDKINSISKNTVTCANKTYVIDDETTVYYKLSKNSYSSVKDSLEAGDTVKLAYAAGGSIDYVIVYKGKTVQSVAANAEYGLIVSCDERVEHGTKKYFATVMTSTEKTEEYQTEKSYKSYVGKPAKLEFSESGILTPQLQSVKRLTGNVDAGFNKIGAYSLSDSCKIIDLMFAPSTSQDYDAKASFITLSDIEKSALYADDTVFYALDAEKKISFIVLNNVTKNGYSYGVLTNLTTVRNSSNYTVDIDGDETVYCVSYKNSSITKGVPVRANIIDGQLLEIRKLASIGKGKLIGFDDNEITLGDTTYAASEDLVFYVLKNYKFDIISKDDIDINKVKTVQLYSESELDKGGIGRVAVITEK